MPKYVLIGLSIAALLLFSAADQARSDEIPTDEVMAEEAPVEEAPVEEVPVEEVPVEEEPPAPTKPTYSEAYGAEPTGYLALSGFVGFDTSDRDVEPHFSGETEDGGGLLVRAGFRIFDPIAIELQGDYFSGFSDFDGWNATINIRIYPIEFWRETPGRFQPYFLAGAGVMGGRPIEALSYQIEGAFRVGGGINYYFTDKLALDVGTDYVTGRSSFKETNYVKISLGMQYNF
jgi:hypothetical protein